MADTTTPEVVEQPTGEETQTPEAPQQTADEQTSETKPDSQGSESPSDPELDKKIEWAKNKGIPTEDLSPAAIKAIEVAMNGEKDFHQSRQNKSLSEELTTDTKADDGIDPEVASFRKERAEARFYKTHPDAEGHELELQAVVKDYPYLRDLFAAGISAELSTQALNAMWEIHKGRSTETEIKAAEARGREQAKQEIAQASVAGTRKGNATTSGSDEKTPEEERLARFSNL
jgi:hypothetical protein